MSDRAILLRWTANLASRQALLAAARARHIAKPTAATKAKVQQRRKQVSDAQAVIARHKPIGSVSDGLVAFVAGFEGGQGRDGLFHAYRDPVGVWTIGYGETRGVKPGMKPWTKQKALAQLRKRLDRDYLAPVLKAADKAGLKLKQHEADALASLVYNLGPGILAQGKTMGDAIRSRDRQRIAQAFLVYTHAGGRELEGLVRRRKAERKMFLG